MPFRLPTDCLNEIFEWLEDKLDLHSCLLVNHLWCEVSIPILWTSIQNHNTLIACLPKESKEILYKNEIFISAPTSKSPLFNYVTFIKSLSMNEIGGKITNLLQKHISFDNDKCIMVLQEIFKMLMNQISLKNLNFNYLCCSFITISDIPFLTYIGAVDCLRNLSELSCCSDVQSEFFYQLSQICYHIQTLRIQFKRVISNGLSDLISIQRNLKSLVIFNDSNCENLVISSLTKLPNTLIKLDIDSGGFYLPLTFLTKFTNLRELVLSFYYHDEYFKYLQHVTFPQLQILKFYYECPNHEYLIKFLEKNGKNLKELYINDIDLNSLNLTIAKCCPNLKSLYITFNDNEMETLKAILNHCQQLESIEIRSGHVLDSNHLNGSKILEVIVNCSPRKFYELKIFLNNMLELFPEELEPVLISWANRIPQKPLSLIINCPASLRIKKENIETIEKFKKLGVIKKFEII